VDKIATSAAQLTNFILFHAYSRKHSVPSSMITNKTVITFLTNWQNSIWDYKLWTIEAENPDKVENNHPQL